jgi:predicted RNase H-like nuclease (RuvC/YqgF family)
MEELIAVQSSQTNDAERVETPGDPRLRGLLDSLSGQVSEAFARLGELHEEISVRQRSVCEREMDLAKRNGELTQQALTLDAKRGEIDAVHRALETRSAELQEQHSRLAEHERALELREKTLEASTLELDVRNEELRSMIEGLDRREKEVREREATLRTAADALEQHRSKVEALAVDLAAREEQLRSTVEGCQRRENDIQQREANLCTAADELDGRRNEVETLEADLALRIAAVRAREEAVARYHEMLGRVQALIIAAPAATSTSEADRDTEPTAPEGAEIVGLESQAGAPVATADADVAFAVSEMPPTIPSCETTEEAAPGEPHAIETPAQAAEPPIDVSDFSPEEIATLNVRRRLRAYGDEFLVAEIRAERAARQEETKRRRWFNR